MKLLILSLLLLVPALSVHAADCGSIVRSVCTQTVYGTATERKVIRVKPTVTPFLVGDRFPVETRSLLMDPMRYGLKPSDGTWRYYAAGGIIYRVATVSGVVVEVIRDHRTLTLR